MTAQRALAALLVAAIVLTHYGYLPLERLGAGLPAASSWWFYIGRGLEGAVALALLALLLRTHTDPVLRIVAFACWLGAIEEAQTALCGAAAFGALELPAHHGLCVDTFGPLPYAAGIALALTWILGGPRGAR